MLLCLFLNTVFLLLTEFSIFFAITFITVKIWDYWNCHIGDGFIPGWLKMVDDAIKIVLM